MWSNTELAYLAGILDGEGCFYISRVVRRSRKKHQSPEYYCKLYVVSTDWVLVEWLQEHFDGTTAARKPRQLGWRTKYEWLVSSKQAAELTEAVYPYLVIKKAHADVFLRFRTTVTSGRDENGRILSLTDDVLAIRHECYLAIKGLNNRSRHSS